MSSNKLWLSCDVLRTPPPLFAQWMFFRFQLLFGLFILPSKLRWITSFSILFRAFSEFPAPAALETIADFSENFFFMSNCLLVLIEKKVMIIILISVLLSFTQAERSRSRCHDNFLFVCCDYAAARGNDCDWRRTVNKLTKLNKNRIQAITSDYITSLIN